MSTTIWTVLRTWIFSCGLRTTLIYHCKHSISTPFLLKQYHSNIPAMRFSTSRPFGCCKQCCVQAAIISDTFEVHIILKKPAIEHECSTAANLIILKLSFCWVFAFLLYANEDVSETLSRLRIIVIMLLELRACYHHFRPPYTQFLKLSGCWTTLSLNSRITLIEKVIYARQ